MSKLEIAIMFLFLGLFLRPWVIVIFTILNNAWVEYVKGREMIRNQNVSTYINCYDKFQREIKEGDFLDVQTVGVKEVFMEEGQLCFTPYDNVEKVCEYFPNDLIIVDNLKNKH